MSVPLHKFYEKDRRLQEIVRCAEGYRAKGIKNHLQEFNEGLAP